MSDILKLLDKIPKWNELQNLPKRVEALEKRLAAIEEKPANQPSRCDLCGGELKVTKVEPHPTFGMMGDKQHTLACQSCDHVDTKRVRQN